MKEKSTTELLNTLKESGIEELGDYITDYTVTKQDYRILSQIIAENGLKTSDVVTNAMAYIAKSYVYDIINGCKTNPTRDKLLILCIASRMNVNQTKKVLVSFGLSPLYAKSARDAIIYACINNKVWNIKEINEQLFKHEQMPLE